MFDAKKDLLEAEIKSSLDTGLMALGHLIVLARETKTKALSEGFSEKEAFELAKAVFEQGMKPVTK